MIPAGNISRTVAGPICVRETLAIWQSIEMGTATSIWFITSFSQIFQTKVTYWISHSYLRGITVAQLWWQLLKWMWSKGHNKYYHKISYHRIRNIFNKEISKQNLSNSHPGRVVPMFEQVCGVWHKRSAIPDIMLNIPMNLQAFQISKSLGSIYSTFPMGCHTNTTRDLLRTLEY